jgi:GTP-binding protein EngB required for normal cell division
MSLQQSLDRFIELVQSHSSLPPELATEAAALRERLSTGQFHLAVLGQFKRGKSTLINALLGAELLPSGVLPVTLVPVFLRFGLQPDLEIRYHNGHTPEHYFLDRLGEFVNEANNPKNQKNVSRVELSYPSDLLQSGVVLIDTPGVGSTLQHNTDTTLDFLPRCDAAIVVLSADPPITAVEVEFLRQLQPHVAHLFFVLNKIDYLDADSAAAAQRFLCETLQTSLGIDAPPIWAVSARQGLEARLNGDERVWSDSGMADLEQALLAFAANGKNATLAKAIQKKTLDLVIRADHLLALEQQAACLPLEELEQKIATFHQYADSARQQRQEISDQLVGDMTRLRQQLERASAGLREKAQVGLMCQAERLNIPTYDRKAMGCFRQAVVDVFDQERQELRVQFGDVTSDVLTSLAERAQQVRENLRRDAANLLAIPHFPLLASEVSIELAEPAWTIDHLPVKLTPTWSSTWMPKAWQKRQQDQQRQALVDEIVVRNVEKIRYWILRIVEESMRRFQRRISRELEETIQQIDRALQAGYQLHQSQAESQQAVVAELAAYQERLSQIRQDIESASFHNQGV